MTKAKFYMIKWFPGSPRTGGDRVFMEIYNAIKDIPEVDVRLVEGFESSRDPNKIKLLLNLIFIHTRKNLYTFKLVKEGYEVYAGSSAGTFEYVQPFPVSTTGTAGKLQKVVATFRELTYKVLQLGINNLRIVIYASQYAQKNFKIEKKGLVEEVILPGMLSNIPNVNLENKEDLILTISRISRGKNLEMLGTMLKGVSYQHYLIGYCDDNVYLNKLRNKLPKTTIIPNASEEQKRDLLKKAKILLHAALYDTAPSVLSEAMAFAAIPIAHKSGGAPEIVPNEFLFDDFHSANEKINYFLRNYNPSIAEKLTSISKQFNVEKFRENIRNSIESYLQNK